MLRSASRLMLCGAIFDAPARRAQLEKLEELTHASDFWSNPEKSQKVMQDRKRLEEAIANDERLATAPAGLGATIRQIWCDLSHVTAPCRS